MSQPSDNVYAEWRTQLVAAPELRDRDGFPPERLLQAVWQRQRLRRDGLRTGDNRMLRVLHPGFVSLEGGPDFRGALIQIGDEPPRAGDVEIDLRPGGWHAHGHDRNAHFKNVILQVVWQDSGTPGSPAARAECPPTLALAHALDAPVDELRITLENEPLRELPENLRGQCCSPLRELADARLTSLLQQAARVRFENKAAQCRTRARHAGWEQALWENLFRALGYKHNAWAMQTLAESRSQWSPGVDSVFACQARLLGVGGLLPDELTRAQKSSDNHLRRVWDLWWRDRDRFNDWVLPRAAWKFHGLRPANHPQRRLALAAHWLADGNLVQRLEQWCAAEVPDKQFPTRLRKILEVEHDEFWSWHWTFKSARLAKPQPLLGDARVTDLAVNVILPWLWARAAAGNNSAFCRKLEQIYFAWPAAEDNSVLKLARQRLLGVGKSRVLRTAAAQQGLLQIVRDFCEHSNALCDHCRFPELVRGWSASRPDS